jgi:hypothetical protein
MDSIRYMLHIVIRTSIALLILVFIWWLVAALYPDLKPQNLFAQKEGKDWLPSPKQYAGVLGKAKVPSEFDNVYTPPAEFNGYKDAYGSGYTYSKTAFVTYTSDGPKVTGGSQELASDDYYKSEAFKRNSNPSFSNNSASVQSNATQTSVIYAQKELFIRNLTMYEGGHIYTGFEFTGEAKNIMFINGKFPIIIADQTGRVVAVMYGEATTDWTVPGWIKFHAKTNAVLPNGARCTMVFEQAKAQYYKEQTPPMRVALPVLCN